MYRIMNIFILMSSLSCAFGLCHLTDAFDHASTSDALGTL